MALENAWKIIQVIYNVMHTISKESPIITFNNIFVCPHCIKNGRPVEEAGKLDLGKVMASSCNKHQLSERCPHPSADYTDLVPTALLHPLPSSK